MGGREGNIHLTMTGVAGFGIESGDIVSVAILAGERFTRRREPVTV